TSMSSRERFDKMRYLINLALAQGLTAQQIEASIGEAVADYSDFNHFLIRRIGEIGREAFDYFESVFGPFYNRRQFLHLYIGWNAEHNTSINLDTIKYMVEERGLRITLPGVYQKIDTEIKNLSTG